jgi:hypothetical protein
MWRQWIASRRSQGRASVSATKKAAPHGTALKS